MKKLSANEARMLAIFEKVGANRDIPIPSIFKEYFGVNVDDTDARVQQQRIGAVISSINKKTFTRIIPGRMKRTYLLLPK